MKIVIGASKIKFDGWFITEQHFLDVTKASHFKRFFHTVKIDKILAEHVLEHLTSKEIELMLKNFYLFSSLKINIRIAVPDGYHPNPAYIDQVRPMGTGEGSKDHKNLFTYKTLSAVFEDAGFKAHPIEYWDENNLFHQGYINDDKGHVRRSFINDTRNANNHPNFTSLIIDFTKQ